MYFLRNDKRETNKGKQSEVNKKEQALGPALIKSSHASYREIFKSSSNKPGPVLDRWPAIRLLHILPALCLLHSLSLFLLLASRFPRSASLSPHRVQSSLAWEHGTMEVLNGCKVVGKAVVSTFKCLEQRITKSASQILVAVDLTAISEEPKKGRPREKAKSCVHITGSSTFQRASFPPAGSPLDRSSEKPQTHSGRQVRFFGKRHVASEKLWQAVTWIGPRKHQRISTSIRLS